MLSTSAINNGMSESNIIAAGVIREVAAAIADSRLVPQIKEKLKLFAI
jgi:hypothetical protein